MVSVPMHHCVSMPCTVCGLGASEFKYVSCTCSPDSAGHHSINCPLYVTPWIEPFPQPVYPTFPAQPVQGWTYTTNTLPWTPPLSDGDVDRIATRVADILDQRRVARKTRKARRKK